MIDHLWDVKKKLAEEDFYFEYPYYAGLPKKISNQLTSDVVDILQEELFLWLENSKTKTQFAKKLSLQLAGILSL